MGDDLQGTRKGANPLCGRKVSRRGILGVRQARSMLGWRASYTEATTAAADSRLRTRRLAPTMKLDADSRIPHLAKMKAACFNQINEYQACLTKHSSAPDEKIQEECGAKLKALWECTDANKPKDI